MRKGQTDIRCPMALLEHMLSPASLLPVATCCYKSVLWPEAYRKKAGAGDTGTGGGRDSSINIQELVSTLCLFRTGY